MAPRKYTCKKQQTFHLLSGLCYNNQSDSKVIVKSIEIVDIYWLNSLLYFFLRGYV